MSDQKIKQCPYCRIWFTLRDFFEDPEIKPLGMTFEEGDLSCNLYFFNHTFDGCGTTFTLKVEVLEKLLRDTDPKEILAGSENCEVHCSNLNDLEECHQECKYAPYRRLLNEMIRIRSKQPA